MDSFAALAQLSSVRSVRSLKAGWEGDSARWLALGLRRLESSSSPGHLANRRSRNSLAGAASTGLPRDCLQFGNLHLTYVLPKYEPLGLPRTKKRPT
jgi:hypothetical protein